MLNSQTARPEKNCTEHLSKFNKHLNKISWILCAWFVVTFNVGVVTSINTSHSYNFPIKSLLSNNLTWYITVGSEI